MAQLRSASQPSWKKGRQNPEQETRMERALAKDEKAWHKGSVIPPKGLYLMRIAICARVSTDDKGQDPENQLHQLRQWCIDAGHQLVHEYVTRKTVGTAPTAASSLPRYFKKPTGPNSDSYCSGHSTASPARGWCRPSCTCNVSTDVAWAFTAIPNRTWPPTMSLCAISYSPCWPRWQKWSRRKSGSELAPVWPAPK